MASFSPTARLEKGHTLVLMGGKVKFSACEGSLPDVLTFVVYKHQVLRTVTVKKAAVNVFVLNEALYSVFHSGCLSRPRKVKLSHNKS